MGASIRALIVAVCCLAASPAGAGVAAGDQAVVQAECSPTRPNGYTPEGAFVSQNYGAGTLVVNLWTWPAVTAQSAVRADGAVHLKLGWWRVEPGELTLAARRLDGPAPAPRASVGPVEAYGEMGFVSSSLLLATRGCYEVIGRLGKTELPFVIRVDVGSERWAPPVAMKPSVRVRSRVATVRWQRAAAGP